MWGWKKKIKNKPKTTAVYYGDTPISGSRALNLSMPLVEKGHDGW